ncbi:MULTISPECIES: response regulator transcription factor [Terrabacteria group]|uniref:response regulator transcription factor n=1 Tax=Bacillati TaxID=1783272 RepID=UPI00193A2A24|nr:MULTISPECIES: response regulator transcription factor [Terrabacteria group]MBW9212532.1 response regulator transcription factor [Trueperella sp. zg.1013]QRG86716.1 response regulator transcription factor [Bulleidia sp. zg-1006]
MDCILLVDDEKDIVEALKIFLAKENFEIKTATNGKEALAIIQQEKVDLVLMDIMMPVMDGVEATKEIRKNKNIPIILLSAKSEGEDKVLGLNIGADDYITKPFNPDEVIARIKAQLRRFKELGMQQEDKDIYSLGGITLNDHLKQVDVDGKEISLTAVEYGILKYFIQNPKKILTSNDIYQEVWKEEPIGSESTIAVHIRHLREKIEIDPSHPRYIKVVWGRGYKAEADYEK